MSEKIKTKKRIKTGTVEQAIESGLIQITVWLFDTPTERKWVVKEVINLTKNMEREIMVVRLKSKLAIFAEDLTSK